MKSQAPSDNDPGRHVAVRRAAAIAIAERERAVLAREESVQSRERALAAKEHALEAREALVQTVADVQQLMDQVRKANERLVVAAVHAQSVSDNAWTDAAEARTELEQIMCQMRDANERLVAASSEARTLEERGRQREEDYRRLSSQLLRLQDEERRRLALDLHDSTAQHLAALIMNLDLLDGVEFLDASLHRALAESRSLAETCVREVRTLAYLLHPPLLEHMGLIAAVRDYVEGYTERSGIRVDLDLSEIGRLPPPVEMALFRVVQESLTNVHRHASSSTARIRLTNATDAVLLEIQDRGRGLRAELKQRNATSAAATMGVGIQGMRERIRQVGGTFDIGFTDKGTTVRVTVPEKTYETSSNPDRR